MMLCHSEANKQLSSSKGILRRMDTLSKEAIVKNIFASCVCRVCSKRKEFDSKGENSCLVDKTPFPKRLDILESKQEVTEIFFLCKSKGQRSTKFGHYSYDDECNSMQVISGIF